MSGLDYLDKLLDGADVEWKPLADVTMSTSNIRWRDTERTYRYIDLTSVSIETKCITQTTEIDAKNAPNRAQKLVEQGDVIFATTRPSQQRYCLIDDEYSGEVASTGYCVLRAKKEKVLPKWILHCISSSEFKSYVEERQGGVAYPAISDALVKAYSIPIPCPETPEKSLAIQAEIVRILDAFTELTAGLTAELAAELAARRKQYNYYRDQLMNHPSGNIALKPLGWVGDVRMCKRVMKNQTSDTGDIPFFKIGTFGGEPDAFISKELFEEYKEKYSYPGIGDVLISASGTIGRAVVFDGKDAFFQDSNIVWLENDETKVLNKYLFHFYQIAKWHVADGGVIKRLYNDNIKRTLIPVPHPDNPEKSLAEQARIVSILDKFSASIRSISDGLPREIELRQKQYEYYRDLLLSFPKPEDVAA
ncbi:restriction endonuclease subunit S [Rhizobium leguminosarum]|uniref:restriction endonuclease subunit S n=1 Tax=Rhizobium leguminosarum TaxID=384 RepID=UPI00098FA162|nr:restriction endonuclease subunit S [Rhizobium leguminosarum]MBB5255982.1 type I restriction enzyme S subunit [Rhizobium leguminosarum]MDX6001300.1 restriction endonuclease subunit S [Rhizobium leguminosarum]OOO44048.1 restriction endonuclease [Rhizobium leguminosarum bv. viciae USDA 2370]PUB63217.1 restriction endonuclease subunit S [Rhizobium leguminosarum bv. viciae USDA 2370]TCA82257.1 restriction endonuclease subunit S [Rhizobium leguminosarum bv. viciae]